jgi:4-diphosphocytidyl-2-C-methyl-D-erythritol kinase
MLYEFAPAKLNLYLHITGRRDDGYHHLDSLVAFAGVGDDIRYEPAHESDNLFQFVIEGPQAASLENADVNDNLVFKAAQSLAALAGKKLLGTLTLIKNLPVASGIGGGSSDAAATLRLLAKYWGISLQDPRLCQAAAQHGQDVPVCLKIGNTYMTASGTKAAPDLPYADIVLVNPLQGLATPKVYQTYRQGTQAFSATAQLTKAPQDLANFVGMLKERHNDLQAAAMINMPDICQILDALNASKDCLLARMSGSGATCFGIYGDRSAARAAAAHLLNLHPDWWVVPSHIPCHTDPRQNF